MKLITLFITNFSFDKFLTDYFARSNFEATRQNFNNILFSPGGESFDFYKNYIDRGNHFNQLLKKIIN